MQDTDKVKFKTDLHSFSLRNSTKTVIDDEKLIPSTYKTEVTTYKVDKTSIKKDILAGEVIEGVHLEENKSLQIK